MCMHRAWGYWSVEVGRYLGRRLGCGPEILPAGWSTNGWVRLVWDFMPRHAKLRTFNILNLFLQ